MTLSIVGWAKAAKALLFRNAPTRRARNRTHRPPLPTLRTMYTRKPQWKDLKPP